jgi:hypothetical protein
MTCFVSLTSVLATRGGTCTPGTRLSVGTFCLLRPLTSPLLLTGQLAPHRPAQMVRILGYLNIPSSASWLILNHVFSFRDCALAVSSIAALAEALASAGAGASSSGSGGSAPATAPTSSSTTTGDQSGAGTLASLTADPLVDSIIDGAPAPAPTPHVSPTVLSPFSVVAYTDCEVWHVPANAPSTSLHCARLCALCDLFVHDHSCVLYQVLMIKPHHLRTLIYSLRDNLQYQQAAVMKVLRRGEGAARSPVRLPLTTQQRH